MFVEAIGQQSPSLSETFAPGKEEFSVSAPCRFTTDLYNQDWKIYRCESEGSFFFITSNADETSSQMGAIRAQAPAGGISTRQFRIGGLACEVIAFVDSEGFYQTIAFVKSQRFYVFHTVTESANNPDVSAFIDSIELGRTIYEKRVQISNPKTILDVLFQPRNASKSYIDSSNASFLKAPNANRTFATKPGQTTTVKVLKTPQPAYTGLGVIYSIQGVVQLRVTFFVKGQIGSVSPVKKLPFGLTNNALAAVRFIEFEPAVRDGVPINVVKPVEYRFAIY